MNNFMKMMLIVFIIIILGILTALLTGVVSSEQSQVTREKTIEGTSVNELFIQTGSADIMLSATNNTTGIRVVLTETKYSKSKSDIQLNVQPEGERLTLSESHGNGFWNIGRHIEMKVEVPRKEFEQIQMRTGSGNIKAEHYKTKLLQFDSSSGNVALSSGSGPVEGQTSSGNVTITGPSIEQPTSIQTKSGDVRVRLAQVPTSLHIDFSGNSGKGKISIPGIQYESHDPHRLVGSFGDGGIQLVVQTKSGDFTLNND